jgi:transposase InsO family protein
MRENDIEIIRTQKYKATTDSNHTFNIAPNLLDQDFSADGPNQKWAGDISYIWTSEYNAKVALEAICAEMTLAALE